MSTRKPAMFDGVPCCSHMACPKYDGKRCDELGYRPSDVCVPEVRALTAERQRILPVYEAAKLWRHQSYDHGDLIRVVDAAEAKEPT